MGVPFFAVKLLSSGGEDSGLQVPSFFGEDDNSLKTIYLTSKVCTLIFDADDKLINPIFKYPQSFGELTSITDIEGAECLSGWTKTEETIADLKYFVYKKTVASAHYGYWYKFA